MRPGEVKQRAVWGSGPGARSEETAVPRPWREGPSWRPSKLEGAGAAGGERERTEGCQVTGGSSRAGGGRAG